VGILRASPQPPRGRWLVAGILLAGTAIQVDGVSVEYTLKAAYLYNFVKFVEWPPAAGTGPLTICVVAENPFGSVLVETPRDETVNARPLVAREIERPETGCHVLFVPVDAAATQYLRAARGTPTLTVGESPGFTMQGGIINFVLQEGTVRFEINTRQAERAGLRISSHLLRLARITDW